MDVNRLRIDLFAFALGALSLLTVGFFVARNGGAVVMCGLCLAGLMTARLAGFSNRALVPLTAGLVFVLVFAWVTPVGNSHQVSAFAHLTGGALVGWALAEYLRTRVAWPIWGLAAVAVVFGLTVLWELGELVGDQVLTTALEPSLRDSVLDIFFGTVGGTGVVALAWLMAPSGSRR
jgi:hypothetical protein